MADAEPHPQPGRRDLTTGPIGRTLMIFALPTLGSNILQSMNGSINAIWVGRFLGEGALAATSNANIIMFLLNAAVFGFGMAATVLVGQAMGRRDVDGARRVMGSAIGLLLAMSIVIAIGGWLGAPALLRMLATPPEVQGLAIAYLRVVFLGMPASFLLILLMMGLRGSGDSMTPLWFMGLAVLLDSAINPFLILGLGPFPRMGIAGSAMALLIGTAIATAGLVVTIYRRDLPIRLRGGELRYLIPDPALLNIIVRRGLPMGLQMMVISVSALLMIGLVNREGMLTSAAYGVALQLWTYIQMPAMAIGAAVSAMAAQNIGAGRWDRVGRIARAGVIANLAITGAAVVLVTLADRPLLGLFLGPDSAAMPIARHIHMVVSWSFLPFGITLVLSGVVRANGSVFMPLLIMIVSLLLLRAGIAYLGYPDYGAEAIWWSFWAGSIAAMLLSMAHYRWGRWRSIKLDAPRDSTETEKAALAQCEPAGRSNPAT